MARPIYTCPMHPEVKQETPGRCPHCGMTLVEQQAGREVPSTQSKHTVIERGWRQYIPLIVILTLLLGTTMILAFRDLQGETFSLPKTLTTFMIGFFLVFAGFKLMGLKGFAEGYSTYDLLAQRVFAYGYVYPFIELFFAGAMLLNLWPRPVLWAEVVVMSFSGLGVAIKLWKRERFQCACLGTFLKVPLTTVTLIEDFGMAALALLILFLT